MPQNQCFAICGYDELKNEECVTSKPLTLVLKNNVKFFKSMSMKFLVVDFEG